MGTKRNLSTLERFLLHVFIPENINECWLWVGSKNQDGYGRFNINHKLYAAHRVSFELFVGPILENLQVLHKCDNPACCNPEHLFLGTFQDNMIDMYKKSRHMTTTKLNKHEICQIKEKINQGYSQREIAKMFGVCQQTISHIKTGKGWRWLK